MLPVMSKIIEKTIHILTLEYLINMTYFISIIQVFARIFLTDSCLVQHTDFILR